MTQHDNILFVPFPIGCDRTGEFYNANTVSGSICFTGGDDENVYIDLPPGTWSIIGETAKMGEEDAKKIVDSIFYPSTNDVIGYENYVDTVFSICDTALESLASLIRSLGLDTKQNYLVLKTNEDQQNSKQ